MAAPTVQDLLILIGGQNVTNLVPPDSIVIENNRGNRISTAKMVVEDGSQLNIIRWQTITIYSASQDVVHFNGYVMDVTTEKRGVKVNYAIECSSIEVRLLRSFINADLVGTDDNLLSDLLTFGYPDLSDIFDWTTGITPALDAEIPLGLQDKNLLDALDMLSSKAGGVPYNQEYPDGGDLRYNLIRNPNLEATLNYYTGSIPTGSFAYGLYGGTWNPSNVIYSTGETGGGIQATSQLITGDHRAWVRIGRNNETESLYFHVSRKENLWMPLRFRFYWTGAVGSPSLGLRLRAVTYNDDGTVYHDGSSIGPLQSSSTQSVWSDFDRAIDLSDEDTIPESGWIEPYLELTRLASGANFVIKLDNFLTEFKYGETEPDPGAYFDGNSANSYWTGATNNSTSIQSKNPLRWGSNRDSPFDVDMDNMTENIFDFEINFPGMDGINSVVMTGGYDFEQVDWIYPGNAQLTHFDLEVPIYPQETFDQPIIYTNIGTDINPSWSTRTVATRQEGFEAGDVLYDLETHWLEFQDAPPNLKFAFRIVGRIKRRIRAVVKDEESIEADGVEMVDKIYINTLTSPSELYDLGYQELTRREPTASVKFMTNEPGILAGDEIDIADSLQGFSETLIVERVTRTYLGGGFGRFEVECGQYNADISDIMTETHRLAEPKPIIDEDITELTLSLLVDDDANGIIDDDNAQLIDVA